MNFEHWKEWNTKVERKKKGVKAQKQKLSSLENTHGYKPLSSLLKQKKFKKVNYLIFKNEIFWC
jgi:hypothetical protein